MVGSVSTWINQPDPDAPETMKTLIAQLGVAGAVETYRNVMLPDLGVNIGRNDLTVDGKSIGKKVAFGTSLTVATRIPKAPMSALKGGWWTAATFAELMSAATRLDPYGFEAQVGE